MFQLSKSPTTFKDNVCLTNIFFVRYNMRSHKLIFLSLLSERRAMRASEKCHPGLGYKIEPRSTCTKGVCATDALLHIDN